MSSIVRFLIGLFNQLGLYSGQNGLDEHLKGLDLECNDYTRQSIYGLVFIWLFVINTAVVLNYYYGFFNRVPWNTWGRWLMNILFSALVVFIIAYLSAYNDFSKGNFCQDLMITNRDCIGFGLTAAIYSLLWSVILSILIKWKSSVNKKVPF